MAENCCWLNLLWEVMLHLEAFFCCWLPGETGEEQVVVIPWAVILEKVMKSLPGKKGPVYHWMKSGVSGFQVCIELDCTGTRYSVVPVGCCSSELKFAGLGLKNNPSPDPAQCGKPTALGMQLMNMEGCFEPICMRCGRSAYCYTINQRRCLQCQICKLSIWEGTLNQYAQGMLNL
ncbi:uncharacterized protein LOC120703735 isoform X2 [Panicum virgatum]|uniref:uncharacterized protein LOC120703735 isoform X2 n=1 Tax=Panicum virgatum TaxID=38727 RepID=UPI0019D56429|nr:uncharacterized protein LOC120703735 isoform X2 [Panicum virgatum]